MVKIETATVLVDSNVLIDVLHPDPNWFAWSREQIERGLMAGSLAINPLIYAEVGAYFRTLAELDEALPETAYRRLALPWKAGFLAGQAFRDYRRQGGTRSSPLPDFYIGAHAQTTGLTLLTRDARRYRTYFPELRLIAPDTHPL